MKRQVVLPFVVFFAVAGSGALYRTVMASDHDDGETDAKARSLNLTDHLAWRDTTDTAKINLAMYVNGRSLPGYQYHFSTQALYEFHITRVADKTAAPTGSDDMTLRFKFEEPDTNSQQAVTLTVFDGTTKLGTGTGKTTTITASRANTLTTSSVTIGGQSYKFFAGPRQDTFFFDVVRYFQVREFLARRILQGDTTATLAADCTGASVTAGSATAAFNAAACAPDFTKGYNVSAIVLQTSIAALKASGETVFDTWSTISVPK